MPKNFPRLLLLCCLLILVGCQSKPDLALKYIDRYNKIDALQGISSLRQSGDTVLLRSYAELVPEEKQDPLAINIVFVSENKLSDEEFNDYENFLPNVLAVDLANDKLGSELIDKEVKFTISYVSPKETKVSGTVLTKAKIAELTTKKDGHNLEMGEGNKNKTLKPEVKQFLISLNHNLPTLLDKELQIKMMKIDVNSLNDLAYTIEVGQLMAEKLKNPEVLKAMEKEIVADPESIRLLSQIKGLGLANIKYVYVDDKGERIADIVISPEDFRK